MMWQDYVMSACCLGFLIALLQALRGQQSVPRQMGWINGSSLLIMSSAQLTLGLYMTALANGFAGGLWLYLARRPS